MRYLVHHLFLNAVEKDENKKALSEGDREYSYKETSIKAGALYKEITKLNLGTNIPMAFYLEHSVDQAFSILAISTAGGYFIPINNQLFPEQVGFILKDSGAKILITTKERFKNIEQALTDCKELKKIIYVEEVLDGPALPQTSPVIENDMGAILYTSGSSGTPKGVMLSHKNLIAGSDIVSEYLKIKEDDYLLGVLPLSFDYGLNQLITMWANGGTYRFQTFKFPNDIVEALAKYNITGFAGIPPIWALLARSKLAKTKLPSLRYITNSGGAVPLPVLDRLKKALPTTKIVLMYGLTEAFRSTYLEPEELAAHPGSMGKAIPNTQIMVVNKEGQLCGPEEEGELVHRGPTVALGYWNRPEETAKRYKVLNPMSGEKVVYSGDIVKYDKDGYLYFVARGDGMIKCRGHRISPTEVEEVVYKSGYVKLAAAIGVPDMAAGQAVKVFVTPVDEKTPENLSSLIIDYCSAHVPPYMVPQYVEILDKMPITGTGKINYPALKEKKV